MKISIVQSLISKNSQHITSVEDYIRELYEHIANYKQHDKNADCDMLYKEIERQKRSLVILARNQKELKEWLASGVNFMRLCKESSRNFKGSVLAGV